MQSLRMAGVFFLFLFSLVSIHVYAAPNTGASNAEMKDVCQLAGGTFTSTIEGNWACCWDNWGCYGCVQGVCKMKCHTQRCRRANGQSAVLQPGEVKIKGKFGTDIVVPKVSTQPSSSNPKQIKNNNTTVNQAQ